jgi:hypothetical protein
MQEEEMAKLKKRMCKNAKDGLKENEEAIISEVLHPRYICKKCLRVASSKNLLCSPKKLEK